MSVVLTVVGDVDLEGDELIVVRFHSPSGGILGGVWGLGFGTIADDD